METILFLHGAIGAAAQLQPLADRFRDSYTVHALDFSGHGGKACTGNTFSISLFAHEVLGFMNLNGLEKVSIFGYSMGGYVGMYLALHHPDRIGKVVTLATKYQWDEAIAARETQMLNPEKIEQKLPAFAATLKERHAPNDWKEVLKRTADMMLSMGADNPLKSSDYAAITTPTLILLGDRDKMVSLDETVAVFKSLPNAQLGILPGTAHPIEQVNLHTLQSIVKEFLG